MAFDRFYNGRNFNTWVFPPETVYCGYGFFHGIFEHFFRENPDVNLGRKLCDHLTKTISDQIPGIRRNCFHGMGHGFMPEPPPKKIWGNAQEMIKTTLKTCETVSPTNTKTENLECMEGAFNVLADWIGEGKYGLKLDKENPFKLCREQPNKDYLYACYYEFSMRVPNYANDDLVKIANVYIKETDEDKIAKVTINSAAAAIIERYLDLDNYEKFITACHGIPERLRTSCIDGLALGLIAHGSPGQEYIKAINFCKSNLLYEDEQEVCYQKILRGFSGSYTKEKLTEVCESIDEKYQQYCFI
jgi:hypothetical protein